MSFAQRLWSSTESTLTPMILVFRLSNSDLMRAMYPSSVVHTGVKSLGWENRTAHELPIHWWKSIGPSVVCAVKFGASSPIRMVLPPHSRCRAHDPNAIRRGAPAGPPSPPPLAALAGGRLRDGRRFVQRLDDVQVPRVVLHARFPQDA